MYNVKLYNKISKVGLDDLDPAKYTCAEDFTDYDAVLVRSAKLHDVEFPKNLRCIAAPVSTTFRSTAAPRKAS